MKKIIILIAVAGCLATTYAKGNKVAETLSKCRFVPYSEKIGVGEPSYVPQGCAPFEVKRPRHVNDLVVKAADFGLDESRTDNGAAIEKAIAEAKRIGAKRVELKAGRYRIHNAGVSIEDFDDFTFDGMGSTLVFYRPARERPDMPQFQLESSGGNFFVRNCHRIVIRNMKVDWDWDIDPLADFARVVTKHVDERDNESYVDLKLTDLKRHPKYPNPVPIALIGKMREDRTNIAAHGWGCNSGYAEGNFGSKNEWLSPNTLRVWPGVIMPNRNQVKCYAKLFSAKNNRNYVKGFEVGALYRILHCYYGQNGFNMHSNTDLTVEDVDIYACRGLGFQVQGTQHHWQVLRSSVAVPKHLLGKRAITSTADANHIVQSLGWCKFEDCHWSLHMDDMNNFHDRLTVAVKDGEKGLRIVNWRGNAYFDGKVGENVGLLNADYTPVAWSGRIVAVNGDTLIMDKTVPQNSQEVFQLYKSDYATDNIIFRRCDFTDGFGRNLLQSRNLTIEDCVFRHTTGLPVGFMSEWTYNAWSEGVGVTNVVIRNCTFEENMVKNGVYGGIRGELFSGARARAAVETWIDNPNVPKTPVPEVSRKAVSGILVEKNRFHNIVGMVWHALPGDDLIFRDNEIVFDAKEDPFYLQEPYRGSCYFESADGVFASGNKFTSAVKGLPNGIYLGGQNSH